MGGFPVLVAPPVSWGVSPHHMGFPGTITLSIETFVGLLCDGTPGASPSRVPPRPVHQWPRRQRRGGRACCAATEHRRHLRSGHHLLWPYHRRAAAPSARAPWGGCRMPARWKPRSFSSCAQSWCIWTWRVPMCERDTAVFSRGTCTTRDRSTRLRHEARLQRRRHRRPDAGDARKRRTESTRRPWRRRPHSSASFKRCGCRLRRLPHCHKDRVHDLAYLLHGAGLRGARQVIAGCRYQEEH